MKKITLAIAVLCFILGSCNDDFIEHDERGVQTLDNYFSTVQECQTFVNDLYKRAFLHYDWFQLLAPRLANETATDDAWMGNTQQNASDFIPAAQYLIAPNRMGYLGGLYQVRYENISACNIAIVGIERSSIRQESKDQFLGESHFFRAYNYYELVNNFGGVPLVLKPLRTDELNITNATKEQVYESIEQDLIKASELLGSSYAAADKGRVTRWACFALLARVSLFQRKMTEAANYATRVINEGGYALEPNFINIWSVNNPNGVESILEAQTNSDNTRALGNKLSTFAGARGELSDNFPSKSSRDVMDGWGWCTPTSDLENCFKSENDVIRLRSTITINGQAAFGDEVNNPTHIWNQNLSKSNRVIRKYYIPIATRRTLISPYNHAPLNMPIIRLAEMYLTRAEATYNTNPAAALNDMNFIRARVRLPAKTGLSGTNLLKAIWKERRMELAFEGIRLYDIRRQIDPDNNRPVIANLMGPSGSFVLYNTTTSTDAFERGNLLELQNKGANFDINRNLVWPIPQFEIDRSQGAIKQNPNYN